MSRIGKGGFIGEGDRTEPSACGAGGIFRLEDLTSPDGLAVTSTSFLAEYLVIAGGGGGGASGGGGAGGYRSSVAGELSGSGCPAEPNPKIRSGEQFCVIVGAGGVGAWPVSGASDERGGDSRFGNICACGGGRAYWSSPSPKENGVVSGGSGGGGSPITVAATGIVTQGSPGGLAPGASGAGGGGACTAGGDGYTCAGYPHGVGGPGGCGIISSITGTAIGRGGGGGGGAFVQSPVPAVVSCCAQGCGGRGGGYPEGLGPFTPSFPDFTVFGAVNTGGGAGYRAGNQSNGGSGVVIVRYPSDWEICGSPGLTITTAFAGSGKYVSSITSGTGNVSWSKA